jgi:hypothetical protein
MTGVFLAGSLIFIAMCSVLPPTGLGHLTSEKRGRSRVFEQGSLRLTPKVTGFINGVRL